MKNNYNIELDLEKIEKLGKLREQQNFRFRSYLKGKDYKKIDKIVHRLNREISEQIDCTQCANCCMKLASCILDTDLDRLQKRLNLSAEEIKRKYTELSEGELFFKNLPCSFLEDKKCTIYDDRPDDCKSFPHLHKEDFIFRLLGVIGNYSVCPIVFNVYEKLKIQLNFR